MTTSVTVETHAWEVDVTREGHTTRVPRGEKHVFYVWDGMDLLIHEVPNVAVNSGYRPE